MNHDNSLIEFPTDFPVKVFGPNSHEFLTEISQIAKNIFPQLKSTDIKSKPSKDNKYISITLGLYVHSQTELDALYMAVQKHPHVKMVL